MKIWQITLISIVYVGAIACTLIYVRKRRAIREKRGANVGLIKAVISK